MLRQFGIASYAFSKFGGSPFQTQGGISNFSKKTHPQKNDEF
jgi:hypothetical protein